MAWRSIRILKQFKFSTGTKFSLCVQRARTRRAVRGSSTNWNALLHVRSKGKDPKINFDAKNSPETENSIDLSMKLIHNENAIISTTSKTPITTRIKQRCKQANGLSIPQALKTPFTIKKPGNKKDETKTYDITNIKYDISKGFITFRLPASGGNSTSSGGPKMVKSTVNDKELEPVTPTGSNN